MPILCLLFTSFFGREIKRFFFYYVNNLPNAVTEGELAMSVSQIHLTPFGRHRQHDWPWQAV